MLYDERRWISKETVEALKWALGYLAVAAGFTFPLWGSLAGIL